MAQQPADIAKLAHILRGAKAIMNKVERGNFQTGNVDGSQLVQETVDHIPNGAVSQGNPLKEFTNVAPSVIQNSNLPEAVKRAMIENPIQKISPTHTFNIDDIPEDLLDKQIPPPQAPRNARQIVNEYTQPSTMNINITENALRGLIKDVLVEYLSDDYAKKLTENTIKKTINMLIKEGKIVTKKKVVKS